MALDLLWVFVAGFLGGVIRGLVGIAKVYLRSPSRKPRIRKGYLALTLLVSGGLGLLVGIFVTEDLRFALLAGYAGTDFLEALFKIKLRKKEW